MRGLKKKILDAKQPTQSTWETREQENYCFFVRKMDGKGCAVLGKITLYYSVRSSSRPHKSTRPPNKLN